MAVVLLLDQALKIWVKTHMYIGESSATDWGWAISWFQLKFTENPGMAFGMTLSDGSGGKMALSIFRIVAIIAFMVYIKILANDKKSHPGFIYCIVLITAGALGNLIDCMFYGMAFSESFGIPNGGVAEFLPATGGYADFLQGKVVDMIYCPIIDAQWPSWMPFCGGKEFTFFSPIFNIADAAVTIGVAMIIIKNKQYFPKDDEDAGTEEQATAAR